MKKRLLGILLCAMMATILLSMTAFATSESYAYTDGVLTILSSDGLNDWKSDTSIEKTAIRKLVVGSEVTTIPAAEFLDCSNLEAVVFEGKIDLTATTDDSVQINPFQNLENLKSVTFEDDVELGYAVFQNCTALESLTFKGTSKLEGSAFYNCPSIKSISFGGKTILTQVALSNSNPTTNSSLTELVFPAGSQVKYGLFSNYTALKSVTFEGNVELGDGVFSNCTALESLTFKGTSKLGGSAFSNCPSIKTLTFGGKTILTGAALSNPTTNSSLTELVFPVGSQVEYSLFSNYTALKSVTFEGDVELGYGVFSNCTALESLTFNGTSKLYGGSFNNCPNIKSISFGGRTILTDGTLSNSSTTNNSLTKLVFPVGSQVGYSRFSNYTALKSVTFEGDVELGYGAFSDCTALKSLTFNGTSTIPAGAFSNCVLLENITFDRAATIENSAFYCSSTAPNTVMKNLILPDGSTLSAGTFSCFTGLKNVIVCADAKLGANILPGCTSLESFYFESETPQDFESLTFANFSPEQITIHVPNAAVDAYKAELDRDTGSNSEVRYNSKFVARVKEHVHTLTHFPEKAATVSEEGNIAYWYCPICAKYFSDEAATKEIKLESTVIPMLAPVITDGDGATVTKGQKQELSFTSNAPTADMIRVELDSTELESKNYTTDSENSYCNITLTADYVATLPVGEHTLGIVSTSGTATATFHVKEKSGSSSSSGSSRYAITVDETQNGSVSVSAKNASKGTTVTVTTTPDKGWTLETLTALDKNGEKVDLDIVTLGEEYTFKMPSGSVTVKATFMEDNTMLNYFADVNAQNYFYDAVLWAAENNITSGTDDSHFSPNAPCTRAQIVTFLWRAAGSPVVNYAMNLSDVSENAYYAEAVRWALSKGITSGTTETTFSPDAICTRAQAVTFLYRASGSPAVSNGTEFGDVADGAYYANAVKWAATEGVTEGTGSDTFSPDNDCTRAQIVTFLWRAMAE